MKSITPAISVLMPVFNAELYLAEAIESILKQSFTDFEFIIINDGSTDGSLKILQSYAQKDNRIRLISRENRGLVASLNEGIALAGAPLIARMDADDISFPERLDLQMRFMNQHPEVVCVGGYWEVIDSAGRALTLLKVAQDNNQIQDLILRGHGAITHPSAMYRKSVVEMLGGYREEYKAAEDLDLWLRLGEVGALANISEPLIKYRFLSNSVSGQHLLLQKESAYNACQAAWERRNIKCNFEFNDWRPSNDKNSIYDFHLRFGWWAYNYNEVFTSLIYAYKGISTIFFKKPAWVLFLCSLLKMLKIRN